MLMVHRQQSCLDTYGLCAACTANRAHIKSCITNVCVQPLNAQKLSEYPNLDGGKVLYWF